MMSNKELKILEYLKTPLPKTLTDIVNETDIYNSKDKKTTVLLYKRYLKKLVDYGFVYEYNRTSEIWSEVIDLIKYSRREINSKIPRKLNHAFQINFLYLLTDTSFLIKPIVFSEKSNFYLCLLIYKHLYDKEIPGPLFWNFINLFLTYIYEKDIIIQKIYEIPFLDYEREILLNVLEESKDVVGWIKSLPFKPNIDKALEFLEYF